MAEQSKNICTELFVAFGGAVISVMLLISYNPDILKRGDPLQGILFQILPALVSGALFGWLFGMAWKLRQASIELAKNLATSNSQLESTNSDFLKHLSHFFHRDPFSMMLVSTPHTGVLGALIRDSLTSGYKNIYNVDENKYLLYLQQAVTNANSYVGIQRHPIRWFKDTTGGKKYLEDLRDRNMSCKIRIFVISEDELDDMNDDLKNNKLLTYYWESTGKAVDTYWITEKELNDTYNIRNHVDDCALYDSHLLINYNPVSKILKFDLDPNCAEMDVFSKYSEQSKAGKSRPFIYIEPPKQ